MANRGIKIEENEMIQIDSEKKDLVNDGAMAAAEAMFKDSKDQARSLSIQSDGLAAHMAKTVKAFDQA